MKICLILGYKSILINAAWDAGWHPHIVVGPWEVAQASRDPRVEGTLHFVDDASKVDSVLATLVRDDIALPDVQVVAPASDEYVVTAALLSHVLTGSAFDAQATAAWRDKELQKRALRRAALPVTSTQLIADLHTFNASQCTLCYPVVLKPVSAAGAADTRLAHHAHELRGHVELLRARTGRRVFLLESFVDGAEYQLDAVVEDGRISFMSLSRYLVKPLEVVSTSQALAVLACDPGQESALYEKIGTLAQRAVAALRIDRAVIHLESFLRPDGEFVLSECGVRLGGAYTCEMVRTKHGVDLAAAYLQVLSGQPSGLKPVLNPRAVAKIFLPTRPGRLISAPTAAEVLAQTQFNVAEVEMLHLPGALLKPAATNAVTRLGDAVIVAESAAAAVESAHGLADWFVQRVRVEALS